MSTYQYDDSGDTDIDQVVFQAERLTNLLHQGKYINKEDRELLIDGICILKLLRANAVK